MHRRRYSELDVGEGRAGKLDFGRRIVEDHGAHKNRVGVSIVALQADLRFELVRVGGLDRLGCSSGEARKFIQCWYTVEGC